MTPNTLPSLFKLVGGVTKRENFTASQSNMSPLFSLVLEGEFKMCNSFINGFVLLLRDNNYNEEHLIAPFRKCLSSIGLGFLNPRS